MPIPKKKKIKHQLAHDAVNTPPSRNPELMRRMYTLLTRCLEARPEMKGIEATIVGSLMGLLPEDSLLISHGDSLENVIFTPASVPEVLDLAPIDPKTRELDPASQISLACGYAMERALRHKPGLVLVFVGRTTSLSANRETFAFAVTHKLPVVVVVQHELSRLKKKDPVNDLSYDVLGTGVAGMTVDGSDAMAVYRVAQEAMYRARHEGGPTLIECKTYRKSNVKPKLRAWVQGDAIAYMEEQLRARNFWLDALKSR
jgi:hypothetical protein